MSSCVTCFPDVAPGVLAAVLVVARPTPPSDTGVAAPTVGMASFRGTPHSVRPVRAYTKGKGGATTEPPRIGPPLTPCDSVLPMARADLCGGPNATQRLVGRAPKSPCVFFPKPTAYLAGSAGLLAS
jgi:hypothetical protein